MAAAEPAEQQEPGAKPLGRERERYCRERALGHGIIESARRAGWSATSGAGSKAERNKRIRERITHLRGLEEQRILAQRAEVEHDLRLLIDANMDDFIVLKEGEAGRVYPLLDLAKLTELDERDRREVMAVVKTIRYTETGPVLELHDKLAALAQLRRLNGLDQPQKHDVDVDQQVNVRIVSYLDESGSE